MLKYNISMALVPSWSTVVIESCQDSKLFDQMVEYLKRQKSQHRLLSERRLLKEMELQKSELLFHLYTESIA